MNLQHSNEDQTLNRFLAVSEVEKADSDLVNRILEAADKRQESVVGLRFYQTLQNLTALALIPRRSYMLACILILGFVIGFHDASSLNTDHNVDTVNDFLYNEGEIL